jgi:hypothetical protein
MLYNIEGLTNRLPPLLYTTASYRNLNLFPFTINKGAGVFRVDLVGICSALLSVRPQAFKTA